MEIITQENNGALEQQYRSGVPNSVSVAAHPSDAQSKVNHDAGIYVQDRWTVKRLTVNAGVRYEIFQAGVGATSSPAGRFVPARSTSEQQVWPTLKDWAPRFNVVYDLFGNAKTALKGSAGKYVSTTGGSQIAAYNPISITSETRNWFDCDRRAPRHARGSRGPPTPTTSRRITKSRRAPTLVSGGRQTEGRSRPEARAQLGLLARRPARTLSTRLRGVLVVSTPTATCGRTGTRPIP